MASVDQPRSNDTTAVSPFVGLNDNPLLPLADGLVRSLGEIDAGRITPEVLESYVAAVENRMACLPVFEISLRLFRHGIRYLISGKESEFVELIQPERRILKQALKITQESPLVSEPGASKSCDSHDHEMDT